MVTTKKAVAKKTPAKKVAAKKTPAKKVAGKSVVTKEQEPSDTKADAPVSWQHQELLKDAARKNARKKKA